MVRIRFSLDDVEFSSKVGKAKIHPTIIRKAVVENITFDDRLQKLYKKYSKNINLRGGGYLFLAYRFEELKEDYMIRSIVMVLEAKYPRKRRRRV